VPRAVVESRVLRCVADNAERRARLDALFAEAGCTGEQRADPHAGGAKLPNLECTLSGTTESRILVGAHFDRIGPGRGVVDNWSGAVLLPCLFEALKAGPRRHTFVFVGFTDEEKGLLGSAAYAHRLGREGRKALAAMVNLDSLGLSVTRVWTSHADPRLVELLRATGRAEGLPVEEGNVEGLGTSDSESFAGRRVPSITIHSVTRETFPILHSSRDDLSAFSLADYYDTYRLLAAYLERLDAELD
jgi:Zn-dependent M28 family amino/carboxypeptidase